MARTGYYPNFKFKDLNSFRETVTEEDKGMSASVNSLAIKVDVNVKKLIVISVINRDYYTTFDIKGNGG